MKDICSFIAKDDESVDIEENDHDCLSQCEEELWKQQLERKVNSMYITIKKIANHFNLN